MALGVGAPRSACALIASSSSSDRGLIAARLQAEYGKSDSGEQPRRCPDAGSLAVARQRAHTCAWTHTYSSA